ncbi:DNA-3-methyladenine glycosylase family protein [Paenibacillus marinisediminis]
MEVFRYGQLEMDYLRQQDEVLGAAIDRLGMLERKVTPEPFSTLVNSVVSQQISTKAALTVWKRLCDTLGEVTPERIVSTDLEAIQTCGMSVRKAGYIKGIGEAAASGMIDFNGFDSMSDAEIIKQLSSLNGIGVWTAEMLLIFSLGRPNVVSWGDLAIRRGMMNLYGLTELKKSEFEKYRERYSPYGSVASLYLWALS